MILRARSYIGRNQPSMVDIAANLWTGSVGPESYAEPAEERYRAAILEQYKIYVDMTDRIGSRRGLTNTFFLTINAGIVTLAGSSVQSLQHAGWTLIIPLIMLVAQCAAWFGIVRSYRQLSSVKFRVIGALEERLPASPYWRAEWTAVGEGRDQRAYWPITRLEQWVPPIFAAAYVFSYIVLLLS